MLDFRAVRHRLLVRFLCLLLLLLTFPSYDATSHGPSQQRARAYLVCSDRAMGTILFCSPRSGNCAWSNIQFLVLWTRTTVPATIHVLFLSFILLSLLRSRTGRRRRLRLTSRTTNTDFPQPRRRSLGISLRGTKRLALVVVFVCERSVSF